MSWGFFCHNIDCVGFPGCVYYECDAYETYLTANAVDTAIWPMDDGQDTTTIPTRLRRLDTSGAVDQLASGEGGTWPTSYSNVTPYTNYTNAPDLCDTLQTGIGHTNPVPATTFENMFKSASTATYFEDFSEARRSASVTVISMGGHHGQDAPADEGCLFTQKFDGFLKRQGESAFAQTCSFNFNFSLNNVSFGLYASGEGDTFYRVPIPAGISRDTNTPRVYQVDYTLRLGSECLVAGNFIEVDFVFYINGVAVWTDGYGKSRGGIVEDFYNDIAGDNFQAVFRDWEGAVGYLTYGAQGEYDPADLYAALERNYTTYYAGDECYPVGCQPYYCDAFQESIIAEAATLWPLDDFLTEPVVPVDGILRKLGTAPIVADLLVEAASWGAAWQPGGTNPIDLLTVPGNIGYCRDVFLYLEEPNTGAWIHSVDEHPSRGNDGISTGDVGIYFVSEQNTGESSILVVSDRFVYTFSGGGDPQRADNLEISVSLDDLTGAYTINMDGRNLSGTSAQILSGGFWVHLKYSRTFGTLSGTTLPYDMVCELYINGTLEATLSQSFQRANIKGSEPYGVPASYAAGDVPGFNIPSRMYMANQNQAVASLYSGENMDMDALKLGWDRNFTTYTLPPECE